MRERWMTISNWCLQTYLSPAHSGRCWRRKPGTNQRPRREQQRRRANCSPVTAMHVATLPDATDRAHQLDSTRRASQLHVRGGEIDLHHARLYPIEVGVCQQSR